MATRQFGSGQRRGNRSSTVRGGGTHSHRESVAEESIVSRSGHAPPVAGERQSKRRQKTGSTGHAYGVPIPEGLHEAIETERGNLAKAESLLGCLVISMEYGTDSVTGPYYPDVAQMARDLVRQSINGLDSLTLQQHLLRNKIREDADLLINDSTYPVPGPDDSNESSVCEYRHFPQRAMPLLAEAR